MKEAVSYIRRAGELETLGYTTWTLDGWVGLDLDFNPVGPGRETEIEAARDRLRGVLNP